MFCSKMVSTSGERRGFLTNTASRPPGSSFSRLADAAAPPATPDLKKDASRNVSLQFGEYFFGLPRILIELNYLA